MALVAVVALAVLVMLVALVAPSAALAQCANEAARAQQHASYLPECRGYEMASPEKKDDEEVSVPGYFSGFEIQYQAAASGRGIAYQFNGPIPGSESGLQFVPAISTLEEAGKPWKTTPLAASALFTSPGTPGPRDDNHFVYYAPTLSCGVEKSVFAEPTPGNEEVALLPAGEQPNEEIENIYVWSQATHGYQLVTDAVPHDPAGLDVRADVYFVDGATPDCRHVVFEEAFNEASRRPQGDYELPISPSNHEFAPVGSLYEWSAEGGLKLASVLPDGTPAHDVATFKAGGQQNSNSTFHEIDEQGTKVFFMAPSDEGKPEEAGTQQVFVRENGSSTVDVSASQGPQPDRGARFAAASADGSRVFFISNYGLTESSSSGAAAAKSCSFTTGSGCDLYVYEAGGLTDLSVDTEAASGDTKGANVRGVVGVSANGEYAYFSTSGRLLSGQGRSEAEDEPESEKEADANVYAARLRAGGAPTLSYVANIRRVEAGSKLLAGSQPFEEVDAIDGNQGTQFMVARVSEDGQYLLLASKNKLTSYENVDQATKLPDFELYEYRYTTGAGSVTCVSCTPTGAPPLEAKEAANPFNVLGPFLEVKDSSVPRNLLDDGRVFFDSFNTLVESPAATQTLHVYEWQPAGLEGCAPGGSQAFDNGCTSLLDNGQSKFPSYLEGASADGENVYFTTFERLAPQDPDGLRDVYDARVGGGLLQAEPPVGCEVGGAECQGREGSPLPFGPHGSEGTSEGQPPLEQVKPNDGVKPSTTRSVGVAKRSHSGNSITLVIAAPGAGRLTVAGAGVAIVQRSVSKLGDYTLKLTLKGSARNAVKHHKKLKVKLRVAFVPVSGTPSAVTVTVTV